MDYSNMKIFLHKSFQAPFCDYQNRVKKKFIAIVYFSFKMLPIRKKSKSATMTPFEMHYFIVLISKRMLYQK